jgi:hypothetical protein
MKLRTAMRRACQRDSEQRLVDKQQQFVGIILEEAAAAKRELSSPRKAYACQQSVRSRLSLSLKERIHNTKCTLSGKILWGKTLTTPAKVSDKIKQQYSHFGKKIKMGKSVRGAIELAVRCKVVLDDQSCRVDKLNDQ